MTEKQQEYYDILVDSGQTIEIVTETDTYVEMRDMDSNDLYLVAHDGLVSINERIV